MNSRETPPNRRKQGLKGHTLTGCLLILLAVAATAGDGPPTDAGRAAGGAATEPDPAELQELLRAAEDAMADGRLLSPASGSALLLYDRVLNLDPDNLAARRGLESIAQHYLDEAMEAAGKRRFEQARAMLAQARLVDPRHPGITPTAEQIELLSSARREFIALEGTRLKARDPVLIEPLRRAGMRSRESGCRAVIHARSDSEGRWIYQQMSTASGQDSERIRADLQIAWPPGIEVLCFSQTGIPASRSQEKQERHE